MKNLLAGFAILLAAGASPPTSASISFDFSGTCLISCARFGIPDGTVFFQPGALKFKDGTDTSAGASLALTDFESFIIFGIDFLSGSVGFITLPILTQGWIADDVLDGFAMDGGPNQFCYHFPAQFTCHGDSFDTTVNNFAFDIAPGDNGHGPVQFTRATAAIPEPAALALFGLGLAGLAASRRRKLN